MSVDTFDELRILAGERNALNSADRALIERAADELESALRLTLSTQQALQESLQHQIATNERLLELQRERAKPKMLMEPLSMGFSATAPWNP